MSDVSRGDTPPPSLDVAGIRQATRLRELRQSNRDAVMHEAFPRIDQDTAEQVRLALVHSGLQPHDADAVVNNATREAVSTFHATVERALRELAPPGIEVSQTSWAEILKSVAALGAADQRQETIRETRLCQCGRDGCIGKEADE